MDRGRIDAARIFEPLKIGAVEIKNRVAMAPMKKKGPISSTCRTAPTRR